MQATISLISYGFSINGLLISYQKEGAKTSLKYDALATCSLLKDAGFIEDFTTDKNGEPVILFTDYNEPCNYGYELWCYFVKSFPITARVAEMLIEYREAHKQAARVIGKVNYLLAPLRTTA